MAINYLGLIPWLVFPGRSGGVTDQPVEALADLFFGRHPLGVVVSGRASRNGSRASAVAPGVAGNFSFSPVQVLVFASPGLVVQAPISIGGLVIYLQDEPGDTNPHFLFGTAANRIGSWLVVPA